MRWLASTNEGWDSGGRHVTKHFKTTPHPKAVTETSLESGTRCLLNAYSFCRERTYITAKIMSKDYEDPDLEGLNLSDSDDHLFDSPVDLKAQAKISALTNGKSGEATQHNKTHPGESSYDAEEIREAQLRQELENIRKINTVIEGVVESLEKAKTNMEVSHIWFHFSGNEASANLDSDQTVNRTVASASTLLQTWTRILSQTEHNQRLILNPSWQGATEDLAAIEAEELQRQRDAHRRQYEEQQRREAAARKAEEDERKREAAALSRGTRGTRGRVRGARAGSSVSGTSSGYGVGGSGRTTPARGASGTARSGSGIGRGLRARGRGLG
jgi:hypothetical protein